MWCVEAVVGVVLRQRWGERGGPQRREDRWARGLKGWVGVDGLRGQLRTPMAGEIWRVFGMDSGLGQEIRGSREEPGGGEEACRWQGVRALCAACGVAAEEGDRGGREKRWRACECRLHGEIVL